MENTVKLRKEIDDAFKWDLSTLFVNDEQFEEALNEIDTYIKQIPLFKGKLNTAENIASYFKTYTEINRKVSQLYCYAYLRQCEDTTDDKAKMLRGKMMPKLVELESLGSFANPEILSLSVETLKEFINSDILKEYRFKLEELLDLKPHTLNSNEEELFSRFSEVLYAPGEISENLMDADMKFDPAVDSKGKQYDLDGLNYIFLQSSQDRVLRENAFHSYLKNTSIL